MILLIFDSVEKMDPIRDTSLQFLDAANFIESEKVYWTTPEQLGWSGGGELSASIPQARCFLFSKGTNGLPNAQTETTFKPLHEFSTIYMRKEPPVDTLFLSITWMLDRALELSPKLRIFNSPAALRGLNEKTIIFEFPDKIAEALVSASPDRITHFSKQFGTDGVVLKPLDGFGGRGVVHLKPEQLSEKHIRDLLPTGSAPVIVQPFDSAVFDGEVRVFCLHGQILSWCLKVPQKGDFLAGTGAGATIESYSPSNADVKTVTEVMDALRVRGVEMVGIDMIGGKISEINITSPRSLFVADQREAIVQSISKSIEQHLAKEA